MLKFLRDSPGFIDGEAAAERVELGKNVAVGVDGRAWEAEAVDPAEGGVAKEDMGSGAVEGNEE
jgi:hypothetical protein